MVLLQLGNLPSKTSGPLFALGIEGSANKVSCRFYAQLLYPGAPLLLLPSGSLLGQPLSLLAATGGSRYRQVYPADGRRRSGRPVRNTGESSENLCDTSWRGLPAEADSTAPSTGDCIENTLFIFRWPMCSAAIVTASLSNCDALRRFWAGSMLFTSFTTPASLNSHQLRHPQPA